MVSIFLPYGAPKPDKDIWVHHQEVDANNGDLKNPCGNNSYWTQTLESHVLPEIQ